MVIDKTVNSGDDGVLRLEIPAPEKNKDFQVTVTISSPAAEQDGDDWAELRRWFAEHPELAEGIHLPPPGRRKYVPFEPIDLPGPTASEILIRDRR